MAEVRPFRGIRYSAAIDLQEVVSPPYDVIEEAEAAELRGRSPFNAIHLDLPIAPVGFSDKYAHAADVFATWQQQGALLKDPEPCFYLIDQTFRGPDGFERTRRGFAARLKLADFSERIVLPHEKTHAGPRADRLELLRATHANMSQIFMLFPDDSGAVSAALAAAAPPERAAKVTDKDGNIHRLRLLRGSAAEAIAALMVKETVFIADGHHRYETALAYRDERRALGDDSADYVMAYFCSMSDPGLAVFPTHRLLKDVEIPPMDEVIARLRPAFEVFPEQDADERAGETLTSHLRSFGGQSKAFGLYFPRERQSVVIELRDLTAVSHLVDEGICADAARLSVTILHLLIFRDALGIDPAKTEGRIDYFADAATAFRKLDSGAYTLGAFLNPTLVSEVRTIAEAGETMPHKSTYFYPKLLSGIVYNAMRD